MKTIPPPCPEPESGRKYWRSLDQLAETPEFRSEIEQLISSARETTVVLMCSEGDPMACHRERLLAQVLRSRAIEVLHILPDGSIYQPEQRSLL